VLLIASMSLTLVSRIYLIYTGEPVLAEKMLHGALLAINDPGDGIPDNQTASDSELPLNQNVLTTILLLLW
jgi:hypothetical protein